MPDQHLDMKSEEERRAVRRASWKRRRARWPSRVHGSLVPAVRG